MNGKRAAPAVNTRLPVLLLLLSLAGIALLQYSLWRVATTLDDRLDRLVDSAAPPVPEAAPTLVAEAPSMTTCIDGQDLREMFQTVLSDHLPGATTGAPAADPLPDPATMPEDNERLVSLQATADLALANATATGIWSPEAADSFYAAVEQLPEAIRFEYYVRQAAALNRGDIVLPEDVDPGRLLR